MSKAFSLPTMLLALILGGCGVNVGGGSGGPMTGSAGAAGGRGSVALQRCTAPVGSVAISSQMSPFLAGLGLPSDSSPAARLVVQQSGCFRIVHRDVAMANMFGERSLMRGGELQAGSNFGQGQMAAADYTLLVEVIGNNENSGGIGASMLAFIPYVGPFAALAAGGVRMQEADVLLTLVDNRSSEQIATATGKASGTSWSLGGGGFGAVAGFGGAFMNTAQGKVVIGAMIDAMNQLNPQLAAMSPRMPARRALARR